MTEIYCQAPHPTRPGKHGVLLATVADNAVPAGRVIGHVSEARDDEHAIFCRTCGEVTVYRIVQKAAA